MCLDIYIKYQRGYLEAIFTTQSHLPPILLFNIPRVRVILFNITRVRVIQFYIPIQQILTASALENNATHALQPVYKESVDHN